MELWTIVYDYGGELPGIIEVREDELKESTYDAAVDLFKKKKQKEIESGLIKSFNVTCTRRYEAVHL